MTEEHESDSIVTVRAQVMTRDESTEGWLPLDGGGLASVSIRKIAKTQPPKFEYCIYGQRISDQTNILNCPISMELKYFKVMPTFHHWRAGCNRNGLTFQTAADARAFDKGVKRAYSELLVGMVKSNPTIVCSPMSKYDLVGDDDVFMTLELPNENRQKTQTSPEGSEKSHKSFSDRLKDSFSNSDSDKLDKIPLATIHYISSTASPTTGTTISHQHSTVVNTISTLAAVTGATQTTGTGAGNNNTSQRSSLSGSTDTTGIGILTAQPIARITTKTKNPAGVSVAGVDGSNAEATVKREDSTSQNYSYVQLTAVHHDYNYPVVDQPVGAQVLNARRDSISTLKKRNALEAQAMAAAQTASKLKQNNIGELLKKDQRLRCRYCHEIYNEDFSRRGECEYAPDAFRTGYEYISAMKCARCMLYHCLSDSEGETVQHPCQCSLETGCTMRWFGLALLSLFVPCLWCYPPLRACHWIGVSCGICGGKHKPEV